MNPTETQGTRDPRCGRDERRGDILLQLQIDSKLRQLMWCGATALTSEPGSTEAGDDNHLSVVRNNHLVLKIVRCVYRFYAVHVSLAD